MVSAGLVIYREGRVSNGNSSWKGFSTVARLPRYPPRLAKRFHAIRALSPAPGADVELRGCCNERHRSIAPLCGLVAT